MTLVAAAAAALYAAVFAATVWALRRRDRLYQPDVDGDGGVADGDAPAPTDGAGTAK